MLGSFFVCFAFIFSFSLCCFVVLLALGEGGFPFFVWLLWFYAKNSRCFEWYFLAGRGEGDLRGLITMVYFRIFES